ncbi:MAG: hypothetical protein ACK4SS_05755 [Cypionkella sp.]
MHKDANINFAPIVAWVLLRPFHTIETIAIPAAVSGLTLDHGIDLQSTQPPFGHKKDDTMTVKRNLLLAAAFIASTHMAAALTTDELAARYQSEGYSYIQIREGLSQYKVEAIRDGVKVETIYDAVTGLVLETESEKIGTIGSADPGVRLRKVSRDFYEREDDDDSGDDLNDSDDDNDGRDDDSDDDKNDDNDDDKNDGNDDDKNDDKDDDKNDDSDDDKDDDNDDGDDD